MRINRSAIVAEITPSPKLASHTAKVVVRLIVRDQGLDSGFVTVWATSSVKVMPGHPCPVIGGPDVNTTAVRSEVREALQELRGLGQKDIAARLRERAKGNGAGVEQEARDRLSPAADFIYQAPDGRRHNHLL